MNILLPLISPIILLLAGCDIISNEGDDHQDLEQQVRIVFGKSIDLVEIGDSASQVIEKLGEPSQILIPDFAGEIWVYGDGTLDTVWVSISEDPGLGLGVISMMVANSYSGMNKDGVGIGMSRSQVLEALEPPDDSNDSYPSNLLDTYVFQNNRFMIHYREDKVYSISMASPARN